MNGFQQRARAIFSPEPGWISPKLAPFPTGTLTAPGTAGAVFRLNLDQLVLQLCGGTNLVEPTKEIRPNLSSADKKGHNWSEAPRLPQEGPWSCIFMRLWESHEELHWNQCPQLDMQKGCIYVKLCATAVSDSGVFFPIVGLISTLTTSYHLWPKQTWPLRKGRLKYGRQDSSSAD